MARPVNDNQETKLKRSLEEPELTGTGLTCKKPCIDEKSEGKENMESDSYEDTENATESDIKIASEEKFNGVEISKLTKRQLKKYKKCLKWQEVKKEKRAKQRIKNKEKRIYAKTHNIDLGPSRKALKKSKMTDSPCKIGVCIDLSFDHLMIDKDMAKTIKQILRVYTENRRAKSPMQLHLCDFNGRSKQEMAKHHGYEHWDIHFHSESYLDLFPKEKFIYLTSESDNVITELEQDKIYIIGGLVDHNAHKGLCFNKAVEQGIAHAQLPISEYFKMKHRKVLTINQVFEILLRVSEGRSFKDALESTLPKRINIQPNEEPDDIKQSQSETVNNIEEGNQTLDEIETSTNSKAVKNIKGDSGCFKGDDVNNTVSGTTKDEHVLQKEPDRKENKNDDLT